jgi:hypothetical protein
MSEVVRCVSINAAAVRLRHGWGPAPARVGCRMRHRMRLGRRTGDACDYVQQRHVLQGGDIHEAP